MVAQALEWVVKIDGGEPRGPRAQHTIQASTADWPRGVFLVRGPMGYRVLVDGQYQTEDLSWNEADQRARVIAELRPPGDGRGYARCKHPGRTACFDEQECLRVTGVCTPATILMREWIDPEDLPESEGEDEPDTSMDVWFDCPF